MSRRGPRIGLVHALRESIAPIEAAFASDWPEAEPITLFDQSLYVDYARAGGLTPELTDRVAILLRHSAACGARAILFTGSLFGVAVEAARAELKVPVLASYEALVARAFAAGRRIGVVATVADTLRLLGEDIERYAQERGERVVLDGVHVAGAVDPLSDVETVELELMLADLQTLENALPKAERTAKSGRPVPEREAFTAQLLEPPAWPNPKTPARYLRSALAFFPLGPACSPTGNAAPSHSG